MSSAPSESVVPPHYERLLKWNAPRQKNSSTCTSQDTPQLESSMTSFWAVPVEKVVGPHTLEELQSIDFEKFWRSRVPASNNTVQRIIIETEQPPVPEGIRVRDFVNVPPSTPLFEKDPDARWIVPSMPRNSKARMAALEEFETTFPLYRTGNRAVPPGGLVITKGGLTAAQEEELKIAHERRAALRECREWLGITQRLSKGDLPSNANDFDHFLELRTPDEVEQYFAQLVHAAERAGYFRPELMDATPLNTPMNSPQKK